MAKISNWMHQVDESECSVNYSNLHVWIQKPSIFVSAPVLKVVLINTYWSTCLASFAVTSIFSSLIGPSSKWGKRFRTRLSLFVVYHYLLELLKHTFIKQYGNWYTHIPRCFQGPIEESDFIHPTLVPSTAFQLDWFWPEPQSNQSYGFWFLSGSFKASQIVCFVISLLPVLFPPKLFTFTTLREVKSLLCQHSFFSFDATHKNLCGFLIWLKNLSQYWN